MGQHIIIGRFKIGGREVLLNLQSGFEFNYCPDSFKGLLRSLVKPSISRVKERYRMITRPYRQPCRDRERVSL